MASYNVRALTPTRLIFLVQSLSVLFSKWLLIGYFRLGYIGLGNWPRRVGAPRGGQKQEKSYCENTTNRPLRGVVTKRTIPDNFIQDQLFLSSYYKLFSADIECTIIRLQPVFQARGAEGGQQFLNYVLLTDNRTY